MARGISGRALGSLDTDGVGQLGAPVFIIYYASTVSSGASSDDNIITNAPFGFRILRAHFRCTEAPGAASDDARLRSGTSGTNWISDSADYSALADNDGMEWTNLDNAYSTILKGGSVSLRKTATVNVTSIDVFLECVRT